MLRFVAFAAALLTAGSLPAQQPSADPQEVHPGQDHPDQAHPQQATPEQAHPQQATPEQGHPQSEQTSTDPNRTLASYVAKPDPTYAWDVHARFQRGAAEIVELRLQSQTWQDIPWRHRLFIIKPGRLDPDRGSQGMLMVGGGRWQEEFDTEVADELPEAADQVVTIAELLGSVMAVVMHVPFQPLFDGLTEDRLIAHTFRNYLEDGDPEWPLLLPMVKSAVRAMDATQEFAAEQWEIDLEAFTLMGGSKRGWTTWLTSAVDERVTGFVPMVIDVLNFADHVPHQTAKWGQPSDSIRAYTELGLDHVLADEAGQALRTIVDPYSYLDVLTQPKLIVIGTNDEFFPLTSLNLYWEEVRPPKYVLYLANNTHSLRDYARLLPTLAHFHAVAAGAQTMPELAWEYQDTGGGVTLCLRADTEPRTARVWLAESDDLEFRDARWSPLRMQEVEGVYTFTLDAPSAPYVALYGEAAFGAGAPFYLSTAVKMLGPDVPGRPPHSEAGVCPE